MKVLYIASGTGMAGGATKSLLAMLREAEKAKIDFEVICPDEKGLTEHLRKLGIMTRVVPFRHACLPLSYGWKNKVKWLPRLIHNYWINVKARKRVTDIAREFAPDIIHENSSAINVGYHAAKRLGIPDVIHIREYGDLDFKMKLPGRSHRLAAPYVYTVSITKDISSHLHQDSNPQATQIYNGIVNRCDFRYNPDKKPYFLYAGRIEEAKGVGLLIDAYVEYASKNDNPLKLKLAGGSNHPDYLRRLQSIARLNNLEDDIIWLGQRDDLDELMYQAAATIIPSRFEALGRVMPEAMANGCLCIGRNTGGTREQMDNARMLMGHDVALSFDTKEELTQLLVDVSKKFWEESPYAEGGQYQKMIADSQTVIDHFFSEEKFGIRINKFYNKILSNRDSYRANGCKRRHSQL